MTSATCNKCGRPLEVGESERCPACAAQRVEFWGKVGKAVVLLGGIVFAIVMKRPPPKPGA